MQCPVFSCRTAVRCRCAAVKCHMWASGAEVISDKEAHDAQLPRARLDVGHKRELAVLQLAHRHQLAVRQQLQQQ